MHSDSPLAHTYGRGRPAEHRSAHNDNSLIFNNLNPLAYSRGYPSTPPIITQGKFFRALLSASAKLSWQEKLLSRAVYHQQQYRFIREDDLL